MMSTRMTPASAHREGDRKRSNEMDLHEYRGADLADCAAPRRLHCRRLRGLGCRDLRLHHETLNPTRHSSSFLRIHYAAKHRARAKIFFGVPRPTANQFTK